MKEVFFAASAQQVSQELQELGRNTIRPKLYITQIVISVLFQNIVTLFVTALTMSEHFLNL